MGRSLGQAWPMPGAHACGAGSRATLASFEQVGRRKVHESAPSAAPHARQPLLAQGRCGSRLWPNALADGSIGILTMVKIPMEPSASSPGQRVGERRLPQVGALGGFARRAAAGAQPAREEGGLCLASAP